MYFISWFTVSQSSACDATCVGYASSFMTGTPWLYSMNHHSHIDGGCEVCSHISNPRIGSVNLCCGFESQANRRVYGRLSMLSPSQQHRVYHILNSWSDTWPLCKLNCINFVRRDLFSTSLPLPKLEDRR
jgi:hypothetical protein